MKYTIVNSFTNIKFKGNPAGVVLVKEFPKESVMQEVAKQLNLVETVFVRRDSIAEQKYTMRYFTPQKELPVAGHPTIAALKVIHKNYNIHSEIDITILTKGKLLKGTIEKTNSEGNTVYSLNMSEIVHGSIIEDRKAITEVLGILENDLIEDLPVKVVDAGLGHIVVPVKTKEALFQIKRNMQPLKEVCQLYGAREVQAFTFDTVEAENDLHTRNICPREGVEDPACGVGNSALLSYLSSISIDKLEFSIEQGYINDFQSIIKGMIVSKSNVRIGGYATIMAEGRIHLW